MHKRTFVYSQPPVSYAIAGCPQCNDDISTMWSEFEDHLWCSKCEIDFFPDHFGIFDGPILMMAANFVGIRFDRICIETNVVHKFNIETGTYNPPLPTEE